MVLQAAPVRSAVLHLLTCALIDAGKIPSGTASDLEDHMDDWWECLLVSGEQSFKSDRVLKILSPSYV